MAYPVGNVVEVSFYFATRALTAPEYSTFTSGGGLPSGVGFDPAAVTFQYRIGGSSPLAASVTKDAVGLYHALVPVTVAETYAYQGVGKDGGGGPLAATEPGYFTGTAF